MVGLGIEQKKYGRFALLCATLCALTIAFAPQVAVAQGDSFDAFDPLGGFGGIEDFGASEPITLDASYEIIEGTRRGILHVEANVGTGWHVYSITQKKGGPTPTKITLLGPDGVKLAGTFTPNTKPHKSISNVWEGLEVEEHEGKVIWSAPIEFTGDLSTERPSLAVKVDGLTCQTDGSCVPFSQTLSVAFRGTKTDPLPAVEKFRDGNYAVTWQIELTPSAAAPGETLSLRITATPDNGYHVYKLVHTDEKNATNLVFKQLSGLVAVSPESSQPSVKKSTDVGEVEYYEGPITWMIPLRIPEGTPDGDLEVSGLIGYQACTETSCLQPKGLQFSGLVRVGTAISDVPANVTVTSVKNREVLEAAANYQPAFASPASDGAPPLVDSGEGSTAKDSAVAGNAIQITESSQTKYSLGVILGMALVGGLILNLMPCVLPVIGLKMMSLVESAGEDRSKVLRHNVFYSLGLLVVFWALAALAISVKYWTGDSFGWGQQFNYVEFRLALTLLVFVMALSFLGTWEIPLPGFASGKASQQLQKQEGAAGSFFKGVFTTILATPCSGPFLGVVFGFTLGANPFVILLIFTTVGIGMALPFLLIGFMPQLVFWLPRPGAWMETLKQLMGFMLLGTVAFLFSGFSNDHRVPVFVTLIGAWFACWMIGRVPNWDTLNRRLTAWSGGIISAIAIGFLAFSFLVPGEVRVPWQPFDTAKLAQLRSEGKTVMVDFTAEWCLNCKVNYKVALNTQPTAELLDELDAVPMLADWTEPNDEIREMLSSLQSNSIPVLAIFPGGSPDNPIVLRDIVTQEQVLEALRQAGPSQASGNLFSSFQPNSNKDRVAQQQDSVNR